MRLKHVRRGAIVVAAIAVLSGLAAMPVAAGLNAGGNVHWVDDDGKADNLHGCAGNGMAFGEIQLAIDASSANDTVKVCPGTYREMLSIAGKPGLTLEAVRPWTATIKPPMIATSTSGFFPAAIHIYSNGVVVRWLNMVVPATGSCDHLMNGVIVDGAKRVSIRSNHFAGGAGDPVHCGLTDAIIYTNAATGFAGYNLVSRFTEDALFVGSGSDVMLYRNTVRFFAFTGCLKTACTSGLMGQTGIYVTGGSTAVIQRNVLKVKASTGSASSGGTGIWVSSATADVSHNTVHGQFDGMIFDQSTGSIESNNVQRTGNAGIFLNGATNVDVGHNIVGNGNGYGLLASFDASGNTIHDNNFAGNSGTDCDDTSVGPANTWTNDLGDDSSPSGLCTPPTP